MITAAEYIALSIAMLGGLTVIGWPAKELISRIGCRDLPLTAPLAGLCVLQVVAWYWFVAGGRGLVVPTATLLILGAVGSIALLSSASRRAQLDRRLVVFAVAALAAAGVVTAVNFYSLFHLSYLTTASLGNGDAANYALISQHLAHHGFSDAGPIVGSDLGQVARTDAFGSNALIGAFAAISGIGAWKLTTVVILTLGILAAYHLALLLRELLPHHEVFAIAISSVVSGTFLFVYIAAQVFTGQVMAMACLPLICLVGIKAAREASLRAVVSIGAAGAVVLLVMLSHYAVMAFLAPPVLLPAMTLADSATRRNWSWSTGVVRRLLRLVLVFGGAAIVAFLVVPQWLTLAYERADLIGGANVGWPLGAFLPVELMGFGTRLATDTNVGRISISVVIMAAFVGAAFIVRKEAGRLARFGSAAVAGILLSYLAIYLNQRDASYRLWKWITFFQPLYAALVLAMFVSAIITVVRRWMPRTSLAVAGAALAFFAAVVTVYTGDVKDGRPPSLLANMRGEAPYLYATVDQWGLSQSAALKQLDDVNVNLGPRDSMWSIYFIPSKHIRMQSFSYYPATPPEADWTIVPNEPAITGDMFRPINEAFRLMQTQRGPTSEQAVGLAASLVVDGSVRDRVSAETGVMVPLKIQNTGTATWMTTGPVGVGVVNIGARLYSSTGAPVALDWVHQSLPVGQPGVVVPPGASVEAQLLLPGIPPGSYVADVQMVSEGVAWFGAEAAVSLMSSDR